ncbi:MAG: glutamate--cysteine ligase [Puniceicoccaceae bacterium]|nr:MAG: glutamate--cysteine ligase [Puniceicoccaceae bacterium]
MTLPASRPLALFEAFGLEAEYMIVRREDFAVVPAVDLLMTDLTGAPSADAPLGDCELSNELAAHVLELKVPRPVADLPAAEAAFHHCIGEINRRLATRGQRLLPGPMHPLMNPAKESRVWPHEGADIYRHYDRVFSCRGHGWFNLQSFHLNLPFTGDEEFALLHAAVILLLPLLPALAAGSPYREGAVTGLQDTRLEVYRTNQARFPSITGPIVPEPILNRADYERSILEPMYAEVAPVDPDGLIRHEWLNSRGAIARFSRGAIEIRVLDLQECPRCDFAIAAFIIAALRWLVERREGFLRKWLLRSPTRLRREQFLGCVNRGLRTPLLLPELRDAFRLPLAVGDARGFWQTVLAAGPGDSLAPADRETIALILGHGTLADRCLALTGPRPAASDFHTLLSRLSSSLETNTPLLP